jgi:hypothetical protein
MSEFINNSKKRVSELKKLMIEINKGKNVEEAKAKLAELMGSIPYGEVVQAEQELIEEGMKQEEILKYCDLHSQALRGNIDLSGAKTAPNGHPVDTFIKENGLVLLEINKLEDIFNKVESKDNLDDASNELLSIKQIFNNLMDIEKHYVRKENLVFPYLEKYEITGPPMVMWGKHDEIRGFLKSAQQIFTQVKNATVEELKGYIAIILRPTIEAIKEMIYKEEKILFPMCMDTFNDIEWYEIYKQSSEIGYTLEAPKAEWKPADVVEEEIKPKESGRITLPTGSFTLKELETFLNTLPIDMTFVDKDDKVRYFSQGKERIFDRNKAILGRQVQFCHPPSSVHVVNKILDDFKSGAQDSATFWINFGGKYVHIAYYAMRDEKGEYLGTLEVTQDIAKYKAIEGERRILEYDKPNNNEVK